MHQVQSKYKYPDKKIGELKREIDRLVSQRANDFRRIREAKGQIIVTWDTHCKTQKTISSRDLGDFKVGDVVAMFGKVVGVHETACKEGSQESSIEYKLLTTRRMI